jgi:hypothetical protein
MATLIEFRQQNPEYNNVPDLALADALHQKFYADKISRPDFFKKLGLVGADIPGAENVTSLPQQEVSLRDRILGTVEAPVLAAGKIASAIISPVAGMFGEAYGGYGTPQGKAMGQQAAKVTSQQFYQPRTETGPQITGAIGEFLGAIPPTPLTSAGTALSTLAPFAANQLRSIVVPAVRQAPATVVNAMTNVMRREEPVMQGMGAAQTSEQLMREERLRRFNIPATKGERTKDLAQQQFESEVERGVLTGISEDAKTKMRNQAIRFKEGQKRNILNEFERMTNQVVGDEGLAIDRSSPRKIGTVIDTALVKQYKDKLKKVDDAYEAARNSGETKQIVDTSKLDQWLVDNAPEAISVPQIKTIEAKLKQLKKATGNKVSIDDLENLYKSAGNLAEGNPSASLFMGKVKGVINDMTEGAGGDLYRAARNERKQLGKQFQDVKRVDDLLSTKPGSTDRKVAFDDVYKHIVLDGSLEEMRTVTSLLKKTDQGRQAYKELQGFTVQKMKDLLLKKGDDTDKILFNNFSNFVTELDREDKLAYMFGKTGRDEILDLKKVVNDILVKEPGAVNYSNTGGVVLRGLEKLLQLPIRIPGAKTAAEYAREKQYAKQLEEALKQPNKLATPSPTVNNLAP